MSIVQKLTNIIDQFKEVYQLHTPIKSTKEALEVLENNREQLKDLIQQYSNTLDSHDYYRIYLAELKSVITGIDEIFDNIDILNNYDTKEAVKQLIEQLSDIKKFFERNPVQIPPISSFPENIPKSLGVSSTPLTKSERDKVTLFTLSKHSLDNLRAGGIPENILEELKPLEDREFTGKDEFLDIITKQIGQEQTAMYQGAILKHATKVVPIMAGEKQPGSESLEIEENVDTSKPSRNKVFIGYSKQDEEWLKKLHVYLTPLERSYNTPQKLDRILRCKIR